MGTVKLKLSEDTFPEQWGKFSERFTALNERLIRDLDACWLDLRQIIENQFEQLGEPPDPTLEKLSLGSYRRARAEAGRVLLREPLQQWERHRPYRRAMMAFESFDRGLEELAASLSSWVDVSGPQALDILGNLSDGGLTRQCARLRRKERPLELREIIGAALRRPAHLRFKSEGDYLLVLGRAIQQLHRDWEVRRNDIDLTARGIGSPQQATAMLVQESRKYSRLQRLADGVIPAWNKSFELTFRQAAGRILGAIVWRREGTVPDISARRKNCQQHWGEQIRALEEEIRFEHALEQCEDRILAAAEISLESLAQERRVLLLEMDHLMSWLRLRLGKDRLDEPLPQSKAEVVPSTSRFAEFDSALKTAIETLPGEVRVVAHLTALPQRKAGSRMLHPRRNALDAFERTGRREISTILQSAEIEHARIVSEIEQAREVVAYALGDQGERDGTDPQITRQALENSLGLLEYYRAEAGVTLSDYDLRLVRVLVDVFSENRLILGRNRLGTIAYLSQQGARQAVMIGTRHAIDAARRAFRLSLNLGQQLGGRFLVYIGWIPEQAAGVSEIVRRPFLPIEFTMDLEAREIPAIYRHLFRFEAVQDPRFLIGREREMEAIAEARSVWESGRPVSVAIIGERGSGKTSLVNCAIVRLLDGLEIVHGEFSERLTTAASLRVFLSQLLQFPDPDHLEEYLGQKRRVIIIEEIERSFLRRVGHYEAVRELQRIIAATCSNTLWIVLTNQIAFRLLDAAVSFGQTFSHYINATSVARDALREAVMLRHRLSGLRVHFTPVTENRAIIGGIRNRILGKADPDAVFFDRLAEESGGVFRSAFEIWLGQIDTVQAGVLFMKPLKVPDLTPIIGGLDQEDLFTMVAVMQHGGLTSTEHAAIFQREPGASRGQIDELVAREILEKDPVRTGYRIRPEALRIVKKALYRRNLI